ncbi:hypothetical protein PS928_06095 [Pseudomonas fluorescens]|uniref:Uncharacterized protein n=1 Tax=Pseudomonas fluorescens TaxID=294 RepID=A0A5E7VSL9_PSEFL|nr:hypothetical protein PS928_06095 [Pseudomonas fluorescens]
MDFSIEGDVSRSELAREELKDSGVCQEASAIVGDHREQARSYMYMEVVGGLHFGRGGFSADKNKTPTCMRR